MTVTYNGDATPELETILAAVEAEIVKAGYTVNEITESSTPGTYVFSATKGKITRNYVYDTDDISEVFAVTVKLAEGLEAFASITSESTVYMNTTEDATVKVTFKDLKSATRNFTATGDATFDAMSSVAIDAKGVAELTLSSSNIDADQEITISWS